MMFYLEIHTSPIGFAALVYNQHQSNRTFIVSLTEAVVPQRHESHMPSLHEVGDPSLLAATMHMIIGSFKI